MGRKKRAKKNVKKRTKKNVKKRTREKKKGVKKIGHALKNTGQGMPE